MSLIRYIRGIVELHSRADMLDGFIHSNIFGVVVSVLEMACFGSAAPFNASQRVDA